VGGNNLRRLEDSGHPKADQLKGMCENKLLVADDGLIKSEGYLL